MNPKPDLLAVLAGLIASRKSLVGSGALVLIGLENFFGHGAWAEKSVVIGTIGSVAIAIITAIGKEDAASKTAAGAIAAAVATTPATTVVAATSGPAQTVPTDDPSTIQVAFDDDSEGITPAETPNSKRGRR